MIEILSPGSSNIRRDRVVKLQLYAKHGVPEYWIIDLKNRAIERYVNQSSSLILQETLDDEETLTTPTLPGFSCRVSEIFSHILKHDYETIHLNRFNNVTCSPLL